MKINNKQTYVRQAKRLSDIAKLATTRYMAYYADNFGQEIRFIDLDGDVFFHLIGILNNIGIVLYNKVKEDGVIRNMPLSDVLKNACYVKKNPFYIRELESQKESYFRIYGKYKDEKEFLFSWDINQHLHICAIIPFYILRMIGDIDYLDVTGDPLLTCRYSLERMNNLQLSRGYAFYNNYYCQRELSRVIVDNNGNTVFPNLDKDIEIQDRPTVFFDVHRYVFFVTENNFEDEDEDDYTMILFEYVGSPLNLGRVYGVINNIESEFEEDIYFIITGFLKSENGKKY